MHMIFQKAFYPRCLRLFYISYLKNAGAHFVMLYWILNIFADCFDSTELNSNECPFNWGKTLPFLESLHIQELMILKRMSSEFCQPWRKIKNSLSISKTRLQRLIKPFYISLLLWEKNIQGT